MTLETFFAFLGKMGLLMLGVFIIALVTPKLASWIDKKRAQNPSPYGDEPSPERVDDDLISENDGSEDSVRTDQNK